DSTTPSPLTTTSRRSFLTGLAGAGVSAVGLAGAGLAIRQATEEPTAEDLAAPGAVSLSDNTLQINGTSVNISVPDHRSLLLVLREDLGLTGTKKGCNLGECGACTVLEDGRPIYACLKLAKECVGKQITTIEGLEKNGRLHPLQQAFMDHAGSQCGFCSPAMIMSGAALLQENPHPTPEQVRMAISGVVCRCGNYPHEVEAILAASRADVGSTGNPAAEGPAVLPPVAGRNKPYPRTETDPPVEIHRDAGSQALAALQRSPRPLDAYPKATGRARYAGDIGFHPDDPIRQPLFAKAVRSPHAHATVVRIDDRKARALPGVRAIMTYREVADSLRADRVYMSGRARFVGETVAVVAADTQEIAQQALDLIHVEWDVHQIFPDIEENLRRDNREVHAEGSVCGFAGPQPADVPTWEARVGNLEEGFAEADLIVEGRYVTSRQVTLPIETHTCVAMWKDGDLHIWDAQQSPFAARAILADTLSLPQEKIHVYADYVGGGFGGKCLDYPDEDLYQLYAALLAKETGKPVRYEYTLNEEMGAGDSRHPFIFETRWGVKSDGTITAQYWKVLADSGAYASSGPAVVLIGCQRLVGTYRTPNYTVEAYGVYSNNQVGGEFRGFGGLQAATAQEMHVDMVAEKLGMNPLEFRLKNSKRPGDLINNDHPYDRTDVDATVRRAAERIGWERWRPPSAKTGLKRRGLGMMQGPMPSGRDPSDGLVWIDRSGTVHLRMGTGNLGNLAHTGIAVIVSQVLGVPVDQMNVTWANTDRDPWTFVTDASRSCHCDGKAAYNAAKDCVRQLLSLGARHLGTSEAQLEVRNGVVGRRGGSGGVDFRTLARLATPRTEFHPYWEPQDQNPYLDQATGETDPKPDMAVTPSTEALAKRILAEGGGIVGLGRYVFDLSTNAWGSCFAEVEVDMRTGQVDVLRLVVAHEIGRVLYPTGAEAQIHGGALQGLGFAMTEDLVLDPESRVPVNTSYYEYRPPTALDYPEMVPILIEAPGESGAFGAKGLGESPIFGPASAIGNAIFNATGVQIPELPYTWDRVHRALKAAGKLATGEVRT
ncbi:MAG TPA: molybdopterin-dependent oxidoreductase, partial [Gemmatimonadales bacterium]|nr:molybdopterin-dependent oxidoreductase [Gemmatimonadales bacterium]